MLKKMQGNADFSGTTFVACVIRGTTLWSANVGDSRITCGERKPDGSGYVARNITDDHKPDSPGEKERILAKGGRVFAVQYDDGIDGPQRVWLGNMDIPGLAMARSLGDTIAALGNLTILGCTPPVMTASTKSPTGKGVVPAR